MPNHRLWIDADQQNSAVTKNAPQNDRWRAEEITPHRTPPFTLIIVADGEGGQGAGEVANQAVGIAFAEAMLRRDDPLPRLLRHLVSQMNEVISQRGTDALVGLTLGAVQGDTLYLIQAGAQTRCYRVRGEKSVQPITAETDTPLGRHTALPSLPIDSYKLKRGDKLVFCTDGLFAGDLVTAADMGKIDRYEDVKGSARHLSALAMGRNVADNVTVVVAAYGRKSRLPIRTLTFELIGLIAAAAIVGFGAFLIARYARILPRPPDLGIAVLAGGRAQQVEQFQVIYPGSDINAAPGSSIHLSLKHRESLQSGLTTSIPNLDLYLGAGSFANLASLDVQGFVDAPNAIIQPTDLTELHLYAGRMLVLSQGTRTFYVWPGELDLSAPPLIILRGEQAALGVTREENRVEAFCLRGSCAIHSGNRSLPLPTPGKVTFSADTETLDSLIPASLEAADWKAWQDLCMELKTNREALTGACQMLVP